MLLQREGEPWAAAQGAGALGRNADLGGWSGAGLATPPLRSAGRHGTEPRERWGSGLANNAKAKEVRSRQAKVASGEQANTTVLP